jgi:predicted DCC family thiol-disulfide oxidoreductase YuxK
MDANKQKVIFFDGVCGLCNGFVDFILTVDKQQVFLFSPLQSEFARKNLPEKMTTDLKSVVYLRDGKQYSKSEAVLKIMSDVGGIWKLSLLGKILPEVMRNKAYDMVAENRYKLFGKKETCRLPSAEERSRFIT